MKTMKKLLSVLLVLAMAVGLFGSLTLASAVSANDEVEVVTERSGNTVNVSLVAKQDLSFGAITFDFSGFDKSVFTYKTYLTPADWPTKEINTTSYRLALSTGREVKVASGSPIVTIQFDLDPAKFVPGTDYRFPFVIGDFYDVDMEDYSTADSTLEGIYREDAAAPTTPPEAGEVDLSSIQISKDIQASAAVNLPAEDFTVVFTPKAASPDKAPLGTPAIPDVKISFAGGRAPADALIATLGTVKFPEAGTYAYTVKEQAGATEGMTYDGQEFELYITIQDDNGTLRLGGYKVVDASGDKSGELAFTNTYSTAGSLTISKEVTARESTEKFDFSIVFDASFTGKIQGKEVAFSAGEAYAFQLADGESITIENIPAGATYSLTEKAAEGYTASAVVVEDGVEGSKTEGTYGEGLTISDKLVGDDDNSVAVTNHYSITPPTGVRVSGEMLVIGLLALLALAGSFVLSRKLKSARQ